MNDLNGKRVAVIGGSGLIGSAIVELLSSYKACPVCIDLKKNNDKVDFIQFDISCLDQIEEFSKKLVSDQKIDALVNVSFARSKGWKRHHEDITWEEWQANVDAQLNSSCLISLYVAKQWAGLGVKGNIVNIGSIFSEVSPPVHLYDNENSYPALPYPAIKGGLLAFSTFLAAKYGRKNIRVNTVSPGVVTGAPASLDDKFQKGMLNNMLGRFADPKEIASPVLFLLSDMSSFITGQNIIVDGGWTKI